MSRFKLLLFTVLPALLMSGCQKVHFKNETEFGKYALDALLKNRDVTGLFYLPQDSLIFNDSMLRRDLHKLASKDLNYRDSLNRQINRWRKKAAELKLKNRKVQFDSVKMYQLNEGKIGTKPRKLRIYFKADTSLFYFDMNYFIKENKRMAAFQLKPPVERFIDTILTDGHTIRIKQYNWRVDDNDNRIIKRFYIIFSNEIFGRTYSRFKYRIELYKTGKKKENTFPFGEKIFSKHYYYNDTLYAGDVVPVRVKDLDDFYLGVRVTPKSFEIYTTIEDYEPEHGRIIIDSETSPYSE